MGSDVIAGLMERIDGTSQTMHNTNHLQFAMAIHLLKRSNPAMRPAVRRATSHRATTRRQLDRAGRGWASSDSRESSTARV
jgi:hypothetical protein